jgi:hypothetical protein
MASPHVAGAALLLRNSFPNATATQVVRCLISGSTQQVLNVDAARHLGGGMLNVRAAYDCLAVEMQQEPPFNCRMQEVPQCVDASSGELGCNMCYMSCDMYPRCDPTDTDDEKRRCGASHSMS